MVNDKPWKCRLFGHRLTLVGSRSLVRRDWERRSTMSLLYAFRCGRCDHVHLWSPTGDDLLRFYEAAEMPTVDAYRSMAEQ